MLITNKYKPQFPKEFTETDLKSIHPSFLTHTPYLEPTHPHQTSLWSHSPQLDPPETHKLAHPFEVGEQKKTQVLAGRSSHITGLIKRMAGLHINTGERKFSQSHGGEIRQPFVGENSHNCSSKLLKRRKSSTTKWEPEFSPAFIVLALVY